MRKSTVAVPKDQAAGSNVVTLQARVRHEHVRWLSLLHLDVSRPEKMADLALLALIQTVYPDATLRELRRELDYLADHELLKVTEKSGGWYLKLTWRGVDLVEFTSPCPPGIGRPVNADF